MHSDNIQEPHTLIRTRRSIYVESQLEVHKSANDKFMVQITFFEVVSNLKLRFNGHNGCGRS
jgi:hypothetical protein